MKILQLFGSFNIGGAEVLTYDVCKNYPTDYGTQHIVSYRGGQLVNAFNHSELNYDYIHKGKFGLSLIYNLRIYVKSNRINIIHVHKSIDIIYVKLATIGLDIKIIHTMHSMGNSFLYRFLRLISGPLVSKTLFVSEDLLNRYSEKFSLNGNYSVLHNGIDSNKLIHDGSNRIRNELKTNRETVFGAMIGNFNAGRNHLTICKALKIVHDRDKNFHFVFVGEAQNDELYNECSDFCEKKGLLSNVHFLGLRSDIPKILSDIDLFIYSSNTDTFGIAVVEAMMSGTPVIVNDLAVFKEITDNGNYAQLYKTKDADDLAKKIEYYIRNPKERKALGEKGKAWTMEHFSIQKHIERLHHIYKEVLKEQ